MFKDVRRKDRKLNNEQAFEIIEKGEYGVLSTSGENGCPYGIPVNYVLYDNSIYFHCAQEGRKLQNINFNNQVSFCVVAYAQVQPEKFISRYESAVVFGQAAEAIGAEKEKAMVEFARRFCKDNFNEVLEHVNHFFNSVKIIKITIEHVTGKSSLQHR
ncbi:MAG: pyridoxamine 5'-phosphate oxidase family protein [Thermincola sp.]|jgi:nitroimidazol reductase NimA-like FMN-containing flavoprotein (pyridoxamine 5'-phosphate oxidase superfamily)|nr:pyridoxamine 5'-phosphate oxidase family protein [Thermincola sp.]MDT3703093.1 pyridoxamine 5'-phosphate oxidase family protein [Thermincola sp.]